MNSSFKPYPCIDDMWLMRVVITPLPGRILAGNVNSTRLDSTRLGEPSRTISTCSSAATVVFASPESDGVYDRGRLNVRMASATVVLR